MHVTTTQEEPNAQIETDITDAIQQEELEEPSNQSNDISNKSSHFSSDNTETVEVDIEAIPSLLRRIARDIVALINTELNDPNAEHVNTQNQNINK